MGKFTLKTDSYLNQFALFRGINQLLTRYEDNKEDKIPSLPQLMADKLYHEWIDLAAIVADIDNWTESDWSNFNICMSLAESCKNRVDSISYALQGLGWEFSSENQNEMTESDGVTHIKIYANEINTPPRLDQIRTKLKRCIEYLILTKNPEVEFDIDRVNILVELSADSLANEIITSNKGVLIDAETTEISIILTISILDSEGHEVSDISSTSDPELGTGYDRYTVCIKDEVTGDVITDRSLYNISAKYLLPIPTLRYSEFTIDTSDWYLDVNSHDPEFYIKSIANSAAYVTDDVDVTYCMTPASPSDELKMAYAEAFLSNIEDGILYFRCTHVPLEPFRVKMFVYPTDGLSAMSTQTQVTLNSSNWDSATKTITVTNDLIDSDVVQYVLTNIPNESELLRYCSSHEVYLDSVGDGTATFKCSVLPDTDLTIPLTIVEPEYIESDTPPKANNDSEAPCVYFDKDTLSTWVIKGEPKLIYPSVGVTYTASLSYGGQDTTKSILIRWI